MVLNKIPLLFNYNQDIPATYVNVFLLSRSRQLDEVERLVKKEMCLFSIFFILLLR